MWSAPAPFSVLVHLKVTTFSKGLHFIRSGLKSESVEIRSIQKFPHRMFPGLFSKALNRSLIISSAACGWPVCSSENTCIEGGMVLSNLYSRLSISWLCSLFNFPKLAFKRKYDLEEICNCSCFYLKILWSACRMSDQKQLLKPIIFGPNTLGTMFPSPCALLASSRWKSKQVGACLRIWSIEGALQATKFVVVGFTLGFAASALRLSLGSVRKHTISIDIWGWGKDRNPAASHRESRSSFLCYV